MKTMSVREAKNAFGLMIDSACAGPMLIERHGRGVVVVVAVEEYERLTAYAYSRSTAIRSPEHRTKSTSHDRQSDRRMLARGAVRLLSDPTSESPASTHDRRCERRISRQSHERC